MTAESKITSPPILDETGKRILYAIQSLRNTDASLSTYGKPADAKIVGDMFDAQEDKINLLLTLLKTILNGGLVSPIIISQRSELINIDAIYVYQNTNDETATEQANDTSGHKGDLLKVNHWYYYYNYRWHDGGNYNQIMSDKTLTQENGFADADTVGKKFDLLNLALDFLDNEVDQIKNDLRANLNADNWNYNATEGTIHLTMNGQDVLDPLYVPTGMYPTKDDELIFATLSWDNGHLLITGGNSSGNIQTDDYCILNIDQNRLVIKTNI